MAVGTVWLPRSAKWKAQLYVGKNPQTGTHSTRSLGQFDTEEEAARAYDAALREHGFTNRRMNFPDPGGDAEPPVKRPPGRPRGKFGPGARQAIKVSRELGIKEGIEIGMARARAQVAAH